MSDIFTKYESFFTDDKPIPYITSFAKEKIKIFLDEIDSEVTEDEEKNESITEEYKKKCDEQVLWITPVLMSDYFNFFHSIHCLTIDKNKIPNPKIISTSYLDFIVDIIEKDVNKDEYANMFISIIGLCLSVEPKNIKYKRDMNNKVILILNNIEINKKEFNEIKQIICYQNMPDYNDEYIDPEIEKELKEIERMKNKDQGVSTLEDQKICVSISSPYKLEELNNLTIRKFIKMLRKIDAKLHYSIYKTGECSGMVSFKEPITHWMCTKDTRFDGLISLDSFKEKMSQVTK